MVAKRSRRSDPSALGGLEPRPRETIHTVYNCSATRGIFFDSNKQMAGNIKKRNQNIRNFDKCWKLYTYNMCSTCIMLRQGKEYIQHDPPQKKKNIHKTTQHAKRSNTVLHTHGVNFLAGTNAVHEFKGSRCIVLDVRFNRLVGTRYAVSTIRLWLV